MKLTFSNLLLIYAVAASAGLPLLDDLWGSEPECTKLGKAVFDKLDDLARLAGIGYCLDSGDLAELPPAGAAEEYESLDGSSVCSQCPEAEIIAGNVGFELDFDITWFIAVDHTCETVYVIFRGSKSIGDWVADFTVVPVPYVNSYDGKSCRSCKVHKGFKKATEEALQKILPVLKSLEYFDCGYNLVVAGHSLGGAAAEYAGLQLKTQCGFEDLTVVTFGAPRVGNARFSQWVDNVVFPYEQTLGCLESGEICGNVRVTKTNDFVTLVPPFPFTHNGVEVVLFQDSLPIRRKNTCIWDKGVNGPSLTDKGIGPFEDFDFMTLLTFESHNIYFTNLVDCN